jgi:hypothetical protein
MFQHVGTRPYNGHVSHEYVEELGKFVQVAFPEEASDRRDAIIILGHLFFIGFIVHPQAPELKAIKRLVIFA